ncbi:MAG TPA: CDP-alcohol phosphatidyltransferase family protein [Chloroflexota bacterium]|nr:CDP-alcohol phosphatidyltransferase family protein [Chloroflexota bacterium]
MGLGASGGRAGRVQKIDTSPFTALARWLARGLIPYLPDSVTPNRVTVFGFTAFAAAGLFFALTRFHPGWYLAAAFGICLHWFTDDLDGELARARLLASERGFFLDLFLDCVGASALTFGLALSGNVHPYLPLTYLALFLLGVVLSLLHVVLRQRQPLGRFGPSEVQMGMVLLALLAFASHGPVVHLAGHPLGWFDVGLLTAFPISLVEISVSATRLYLELDATTGTP